MTLEEHLDEINKLFESLLEHHKVTVQYLVEEDTGNGWQVWGHMGANKKADSSFWMTVMMILCDKHKILRRLGEHDDILQHIGIILLKLTEEEPSTKKNTH